MLNNCLNRTIRARLPYVSNCRYFHHEFTQPEITKKDSKNEPLKGNSQNEQTLAGAVQHKYKVFRDDDAVEIFDVEEQRNRYHIQDEPEHIDNQYMNLNLARGIRGVFDISDLVDVLRKESAEDIFVCTVPKDLKYVDHLVVCSGRSYRHMLAMASFVRRMYKIKRTKGDILPKIEGEKSREWMALDLGNIALHIFSPKSRELYDLESLWAIGSEYDKETNKPEDSFVQLFESHRILLSDIKPKTI